MPWLRERGGTPPIPHIPSLRAPAQPNRYLDKTIRSFYGAEIFVVVFTASYPEPDGSSQQ